MPIQELRVYEKSSLAVERLAQHGADILLPEMWGFDLLDRVKESDLRTEVVRLTGSYSFDLAVTPITRGGASIPSSITFEAAGQP